MGRLLLEELVDLALSRGFHTVIARIAGGNEPSIALHRACGFAMVGVEREVGREIRPLDRRGRHAADVVIQAST